MPTPLDRALNQRNLTLGFAGLVTAVAAWTIWGSGSIFPPDPDPKGDPDIWTHEELRRWLNNRGLLPRGSATRDELLDRVKANMRDRKHG